MANPALTVVGLGEALVDVDIASGSQTLGGAPLNVAAHAHQLLQARGGEGLVASRINPKDAPGRLVLAEMAALGLRDRYLQRTSASPTGVVHVHHEADDVRYEIVENVAWDGLQSTDEWAHLAATSGAACFGTLAQRSPTSRYTIQQFLRSAPQAIRLLDVNLRQHYYTADLLHQSCTLASIVKLNETELPLVRDLLHLTGDPLCDLRSRFNLTHVVLTRGSRGTLLLGPSGLIESPSHLTVANPHPVGAGDACTAGILTGLLLAWPDSATVHLANHLGAYVASQPTATPPLPQSLLAFR